MSQDQASRGPSPARRWPWLIYLLLFFAPWRSGLPSLPILLATGAGLALFLFLFLSAPRAGEKRLLPTAAAILVIAGALAFSGGIWTVIAIYAAALAGELRPFRKACIVVVVFALLVAAFAFVIRQPITYWDLGVFMMLAAGFGAASRVRLEDQTRALAEARGEVRRLAEVAERERIGRDLHDLLGRSLTLIALKADLAARLIRRDADAAERETQEIATAARSALGEVRAAVQGMRDVSLSDEVEVSRAALATAGVGCEVTGDAAGVPVSARAVLAMALREAVTNVIRHAGADLCTIAIEADKDRVRLSVKDNGDGRGLAEGGGLSGMRDRLRAAGGLLDIDAGEQGTRVTAVLPLGSVA
jgi:two-component system sensor histidine kinase DesK